MKYMALVLSSCFLIACGGGGGGGGGSGGSEGSGGASASALAAVSLAKYAGAWSFCYGHDQETLTIADAGNGGYSTTLTQKVFAGDRCADPVVATGSYGQPMTTMVGIRTVPNAIIAMIGGTVVDTVDLVTVKAATAHFAWTDSSGLPLGAYDGVTTTATFAYSGDSVTLTRHAVNGETTQGALLLRKGTMYTLQSDAGSTTHFSVTGQYTQ